MKSFGIYRIGLLIVLVIGFIQAMPPRPGLELPPEDYEEMARLGINVSKNPIRDAGKRGVFNKPGDVTPLVTGTKQFPVVCIKYPDLANVYTVDNFQAMLFSDTWTSGSAKKYYQDISYNTFTLQGTVVGWYTSANNKAYYGYSNGSARAAALAKEAAIASDATVNYALYDNDGDGYVDCFTCIHAGFGREETGSGTDIHSHSWDFTSAGIGAYTTNDPDPINGGYIKINEYVIDPERSNYSNKGTMVCIGVFCHEWGHALSLPDLYDTDGGGEGLGNWCLMAGGSWGTNGNSPWYPAHLSAWGKMELGWLNPTAVRGRKLYAISEVENNAKAYWLVGRQRTFREYFLIENRRKTGFDVNMYGQGLLIYHIDDSVIEKRRNSNAVNNGGTGWKYGVALEQADGLDELFSGADRGDADDPWPGGLNRTSFDSTSTTPNTRTNYPSASTLITSSFVKNIPASATIMSCTLSSGVVGAYTSGVDGAGYSWIDSDTAGGPTYNWIDISQTGTALGTGDNQLYWFRLPYNFNFYGTSYDTVWVSTNGWISFGTNPGTSAFSNVSIPATTAPNRAVYVFWDDLNLVAADNANIYYQTFGTTPNRYTVITWKDARHYNVVPADLRPANQVTFQVILHENGKIITQYKDCAVGDSSYNWGKSATIGIENANGTIGRQYLYNGSPTGNLVASERAIQFSCKDVGVVSIDNPIGTVDSTGPITPRVTIKNYSSGTENISVTFIITGGYVNTRTKTLGPGQQDTVNFTAWQPVRGAFTAKCSTYLLNDGVKTNDTLSAPFIVRVRNVGVVSIQSPLGTFDSLGPVIPSAIIQNYGSGSETFNVKMRIGSIYSQTVQKTIGPGLSDVATFPAWVPVRGTYQIRCSTMLDNDVQYSNDTMTNSITVNVKDVGITQIVAPTGTIDSAGPIVPQIKLKNFGTSQATFNAKLKIGTTYNRDSTITINAGNENTYNFPVWQPTRGVYAVRCSVYLAGDASATNDTLSGAVTIRVKDIGIVAINNPAGTFDSTGTIIPQVTLMNYGSETETFNVKLRFGSYNQTRTKTLVTGQQDTVNFPSWIPIRGSYQSKCSTMLAGDVKYVNDTLSGSFAVQVKDVGVTQIIAPTGVIDSSPPIIPQVKIKNYGTSQAVFNVWLRIGTGYDVNRSKTINAGVEDTVNFTSWQPIRGTHLVRCSVNLTNDAVSSNDTLTGSVLVSVKDIQVMAIEYPIDSIDSGAPIIPRARIKSNSSTNETFDVTLKIGSSYTQTRSKTLASNQEDTVNFPSWMGARGNYVIRCSTYLAGDIDNSNDTLSDLFTVVVHDVGVVSITAPTDSILRGLWTPRASVRNYGSRRESFYSYCKIYNNSGMMVYIDSSFSNNLNINTSSTRTFDEFLFLTGTYTIRCSTALINDSNPYNNVKSKTVTVIYQPPWTLKESVPKGPSSKQLRNGSVLVAGAGDIYLLKGNNTCEFYRYDVENDTWLILRPIPYDTLKEKNVNKGAALAYNNHANPDLIYAAKGNNTDEFWAYDVGNDTWYRKTGVPINPVKVKKVKAGASMVYLRRGTNQYIYLLKGNGTNEFYAYHCQADTWIRNLEQPPLGPYIKFYKEGSCMTVGYNNYIYLLKGGSKTNEFYCYIPAEDSWLTLESLPIYSTITKKKSKVKAGAGICYDGDSLLYVIKGGNRQEFWQYNAIRNNWRELDTIPRAPSNKKVSSGGSIVFSNDRIFVVKGNKTFEFWSYTPGISDIPATISNMTYYNPVNIPIETQDLSDNDFIRLVPNNDVLTLKLVLKREGQIKINIYNSLGQKVRAVFEGGLRAGMHLIPISNEYLETGIYIVNCQINNHIKQIKFVVY